MFNSPPKKLKSLTSNVNVVVSSSLSANKRAHLLGISTDALCHAILFLDIHEIKLVSSLCQRMVKISNQALSQVRNICMDNRVVEKYCDFDGNYQSGQDATMVLATVWMKCRNLRTATFAGCSFQDIVGTLLACSKLRELTCDIGNLVRFEQMRIISMVAENTPRLEYVDLTGFRSGLDVSVVPFARHCRDLISLNLAASPSPVDCQEDKTKVTGMAEVLRKCTKLSELLLIVMKSDLVSALQRVGPVRHITRLELVGCSENASICKFICDYLPNVQVLNLSENSLIGDTGVEILAQGRLDIEMLNIYETSHTNRSLEILLHRHVFPNLAHLSIHSINTDILRRFAVLKRQCKIYTASVEDLSKTAVVLDPFSH